MKKLNIGAGDTYIPGFVNIDIDEKAEITLNLSEEPLPFETSSVDMIFSYHTLEHVPNYLFALSEIYRVLKPGGVFLLGVPYVSLTKYNLVNPYHLHNFNEHSFAFFDSIKGSAVEKNDIAFKKIYHKCYYMRGFKLLPYPLNRWCKNHLFNVVRKIDFGVVAIKEENDHNNLPTKSELKQLFKDTIQQRRPYEQSDKPPVNGGKIGNIFKKASIWWQGHF